MPLNAPSAQTSTAVNAPSSNGDAARSDAHLCPGCHFGCPLDDYQCARGQKLSAKWQQGETIPERRMPGPRGPKGAGKHPGGDIHLMRMLGICAMVLEHRHEQAPEHKVAEAALRQDGFASVRIVAERAQLDPARAAETLENARDSGLVELVADERVGAFVHITDAGKEQAKTWGEERRAGDAEFLAALDEDERAQLADLLAKLLEPQREKMMAQRH